jgi:hypothetical protein
MPELPSNIEEFNIIAGIIFAQLYRAFPVRVPIDIAPIGKAMGFEGKRWDVEELPSGRPLLHITQSTISWLHRENFIDVSEASGGPLGGPPWTAQTVLTVKGLMALNAIPPGLSLSVGAKLTEVADSGSRSAFGSVGDLIGGIIGGATKSIASG